MREIENFASLLQEAGYRAQTSEFTVETGVGGFQCTVFYFAGLGYFNMYCPFGTKTREMFSDQDINEFNKETRFAKCYRRPNSLCFEQDFLFDINDDNKLQKLEKIMQHWEAVLGKAGDKFRELAERQRSAAADAAGS